MNASSRPEREIEFLYWDGCPSADEARALLDEVLAFFSVPANVQARLIATQEDAVELAFPGSPTIRIDGQDVDPAGADAPPSLTCRIYRRPAGVVSPVPSMQQIQRALRLSLPLGSPAPEFSLPCVDGRRHSLADYSEAELLVLIQSCNHCPYVQAWEGRIDAVTSDYAQRGVRVVAICSNDAATHPDDAFPEMVARARDRRFSFDYLHDEDQALALALGATRTPEVFVFDRDRALAYHGAVDDNHDEGAVSDRYLRDALDSLLADEPPRVSETQPVGCFVKWRGLGG
jgi:peroxiredoxin